MLPIHIEQNYTLCSSNTKFDRFDYSIQPNKRNFEYDKLYKIHRLLTTYLKML